MDPYAKANVKHGFSQEEIAEAVKATLLLLWGYEEPCPGTFESDVGISSWTSGGERFTVDITREGIIKIVSESKAPNRFFPAFVYDNRNKQNVKDFLNALKFSVSTSGLAKAKPEAYSLLLSTGRSTTDIVSRPVSEHILGFILFMVIMIILAFIIVPLVVVFCLASAHLISFLLSP